MADTQITIFYDFPFPDRNVARRIRREMYAKGKGGMFRLIADAGLCYLRTDAIGRGLMKARGFDWLLRPEMATV